MLLGKRIAITGSIPDHIRADVVQAISRSGGIYTRSVSKNTDILVVGRLRQESRKLKSAQRLAQNGKGPQQIPASEFVETLFIDRQS